MCVSHLGHRKQANGLTSNTYRNDTKQQHGAIQIKLDLILTESEGYKVQFKTYFKCKLSKYEMRCSDSIPTVYPLNMPSRALHGSK